MGKKLIPLAEQTYLRPSDDENVGTLFVLSKQEINDDLKDFKIVINKSFNDQKPSEGTKGPSGNGGEVVDRVVNTYLLDGQYRICRYELSRS
ncbi:hypothetical protein [Methyloglobulus sp.]|uniref:hypothetical protein n=1 Tax=Methyloglobulus sp. TaxID=2518622 RepID=UPI0032B7D185